MESLDFIQQILTEALEFIPSSHSKEYSVAVATALSPTNIIQPRKRPRASASANKPLGEELAFIKPKEPSKVRKPYKRRAERPLPIVSPPCEGDQYTKKEVMEILTSLGHVKDRTNLINHWIATKLIPVTTPITINKYLRDYKRGTWKPDWETDPILGEIPPPQDGMAYQRQEACRILLPLEPKQRVKLVSQWMASKKIPVKSMSAVERTLKKATQEGIDGIPIQWGRWGESKHNDDAYIPPHPPPRHNDEYTKLEAISILQKMTPADRNIVLWKWIGQKQIPIRHPNSMVRILRDAQLGRTFSLDWKGSSGPCYMPQPRNGTTYEKMEFIGLVSKLSSKERNELIRQWVHQGKIPYTCPLSANAAVMKYIKASGHGTKAGEKNPTKAPTNDAIPKGIVEKE